MQVSKTLFRCLHICSGVRENNPFGFYLLQSARIHARSHDSEEGVISEHGSYGTTVV